MIASGPIFFQCSPPDDRAMLSPKMSLTCRSGAQLPATARIQVDAAIRR